MKTINCGELSFELRESNRRRTVEITIEPDGQLILATPPKVPLDKLEKIINQRRFWIYSKLLQKETIKQPPSEPQTYLPGQGFYYLGRSYRLKLVDTAQIPLRLYQGRFELLRQHQQLGRELFINWYRSRIKQHLESIAPPIASRIGKQPKSIQIRELGNRWGSCNSKHDIYFHWRVAMLPHKMIEYVVIHEMVHLVQPLHNQDFWDKVERILPDWEERKEWLAKNGAVFTL
ncbi:MAG: M48 family metallopeptidase [Richelia sp. RM2_1_2]|nr:M48 family metallopeptidase [Richelia sp. SM1_7_0]NJN06663.1 M48 family metallopeptidase [Richelia sp. RM1_1_1]NJO59238.1 M48 family metallopeptidase [Richelia sp. RM2_1_2]